MKDRSTNGNYCVTAKQFGADCSKKPPDLEIFTNHSPNISRFLSEFAQLDDQNLATPEPSILPEYVNPYPLTHPCYRFADISSKQFFSPAFPDAPTYPNNTKCSVVLTASNPEIKECKKEISNQEEGRFSRDDVPANIIEFDRLFDMPVDCMWVITVRVNWRIQLQFERFELDSPNDCESNFVEVFSNDTTNSKKQFCGSIADTILSDTNHNVLIVRFYSQHFQNKTTFAANFTAFRPYDKDDPNGKCTEDEFDCDDATCISASLKCNGFYNCRFRWDEDNCHGSESWALTDDHIVIIMVIFSLILTGMFFTFIYNCIKKLVRDHQTIKEFKRSREQLDKDNEEDKRSSKGHSGPHRTPSIESTRFGPSDSATTPCYVPGEDILPILIKNSHSVPSNGSMYNQDIYTVDNEEVPKMCDSACQTRESLFTTQEYSSGNSTPNNSVHTNSPPAPFSTFGYNRKDSNKFKAEAKIEMHHDKSLTPSSKYDKRYSVQTTKSAPDVIVTH
ncbi:hypothetical protein HUJ04_013261 [Dendroctonus ponderosae]|nr:hypothetical protein HUJ04_013261 [Dendroctonus ponderosae]